MSEVYRNIENESIETICKDCIFAAYHDPKDPKLQTGCDAGQIEKYIAQNTHLKEYIDEDDRKFFGVVNRVCLYFRTKEWYNKQPVDQNILDIARDEMTLRMEAMIYIDENSDFAEIGTTVDSLVRGKIKPSCIIFCDHKNIKPSTFRSWADVRCNKTAWRAEHIRESEADFLRCVDICMRKAKSRFVAIFDAGFIVPEDFVSTIDIAIHDKLDRFLYLEPADGMHNGTVIQNFANRNFHGNRDNPLIEKIRTKALEQECPHMVRNVTEIVPSMKNKSPTSLSSYLVTTMQGT